MTDPWHPLNSRIVLFLVEGVAWVLDLTLGPILRRLFPTGLCTCPERKPGQVHVRGGKHVYRTDNDD